MLNEINKAFAKLDALMYTKQLKWVLERKNALKEYEAAYCLKPKSEQNIWVKYPEMHRLCGGKTWYGIIADNSVKMLPQIIRKNVDALIAKRNARIIAALNKKDITEIEPFELEEYGDGFEGVFYVDGHCVSIRTILAGGYNIQCLHQRTLIKVT